MREHGNGMHFPSPMDHRAGEASCESSVECRERLGDRLRFWFFPLHPASANRETRVLAGFGLFRQLPVKRFGLLVRYVTGAGSGPSCKSLGNTRFGG